MYLIPKPDFMDSQVQDLLRGEPGREEKYTRNLKETPGRQASSNRKPLPSSMFVARVDRRSCLRKESLVQMFFASGKVVSHWPIGHE